MEMFVPQVGYNKTELQILRSHPRYTHSFVSYDNSSTTGLHGPRRCMAQSVRMRKVGCSNPSRDRTKSLKQEETAPLLNTQQQIWVARSSEMTIINGCPVPQYVWHAKNFYCPIAISARHRSKCSPSLVIVTSLHEWKILKWGRKNHKQTKKTRVSMGTKRTKEKFTKCFTMMTVSRPHNHIQIKFLAKLNLITYRRLYTFLKFSEGLFRIVLLIFFK